MNKALQLERNNILTFKISNLALFLIFIPPFFSAFIAKSKLLSPVLIASTIFILIISALYTRNKIKKIPIYYILLMIFLVFIIINRNYDLSHGTYTWTLQFIGVAFASFCIANESDDSWTRAFSHILATLGLIYSVATIIFWLLPQAYEIVYPILQNLSSTQISGAGYRAGLTTHYSTNGMYIALGFVACFCMSLENVKNNKWIIATCVCLFALILTTKRAHLAFSIASVTLTYLIVNSKKGVSSVGKIMIIGSVALITLYFLSLTNSDVMLVFQRFGEMQDDETFGGREQFYDLCLNMWSRNPIIGFGWGAYTVQFNQTSLGQYYQLIGYGSMDAHNVYLELLAEEGAIGFTLFILIMITALVATIATMLYQNHLIEVVDSGELLKKRSILAVALAIQIFFAMYCLTGNPLYDIQMYIPWLLSVAASTSIAINLIKFKYF